MGIFWRREAVSATDNRVWKSVPSVGPGPTAARTRVNSAIEFAMLSIRAAHQMLR